VQVALDPQRSVPEGFTPDTTDKSIYCLPGRSDPEATCRMTELGDIFADLGISHYLSDFVEQGFDTWDTILDITESDFDALGVKLGHRRKLQRKIANSRGLSSDRALASPRNTPTDDRGPDEQKQGGLAKPDLKDVGSGTQSAKRKYRRHPKPDENAPERPPSAYVIFSNKMREELKGRSLSFTEIAKLVGENWQSISPSEKEPYEQQASTDKERYNNELSEYKKTPQYKEYSQYLAEFKARQANQQQVADLEAKRPKLEPHPSNTSSGTASSGASLYGDSSTGRVRVASAASATSQWPIHDSQPSPQSSTIPGSLKRPGSPSLNSSAILPGYRESIYGGSHQSLPWRDGQKQRDDQAPRPSQQQSQFPRINNITDRHLSQPVNDPLNLTGSAQHAHRATHPTPKHTPPLLTSESTNMSTASTSTNSSAYFTPRTPLEPVIDRSLSISSIYTQKSYENQLPPLRPPSLSPQTSIHAQYSPNGIHPTMDFPTSIAPFRGYTSTTAGPSRHSVEASDDRLQDFGSFDENMDPVSALIRAGEIVNRNSRG